ncbi:hypothetical protein [Paenibacillus aestuarii]|uniref:Uncharacterized protein n=1 Tax=Paenibacillus aestuarii TaxID=516965 RepID=A0ABW0KH76_9BACL|nr:hypothetical protein [Paenibacillus aestuarii]
MTRQKMRKIILITAIASLVSTMPLSAFAATKSATTHPSAAQHKAVHSTVNSVQSQKKSLHAQLAKVQKSIENTKKLLEQAKQGQHQAKISMKNSFNAWKQSKKIFKRN